MLSIPCPWCGQRGEHEFRFGGEPVTRPTPATAVSDTQWADYLYCRANPKGAATELWCHAGGCGQWFQMDRDTVTHEIAQTRGIGA